ncbi:Hypothetical predicted protein [Paramuricea clavata]|uniref:Uncharacterized protein n=1 Tax=Paramuricea clavata TaxID=317549 RepID=A0A6S7IIR9_PARCT|nr:Hypothetical predicted protein [Paramuricea clavata]
MHFTATFGPRPCNPAQLLEELSSFVPLTEPNNSLFDAPSPDELATKLRSICNSAPGQDRLEYCHLRLLDPKCEILRLLDPKCEMHVPAAWKSATTILIHKKEDTSDASNFRPITLMSCLYKLLMAVLSKRMTSFTIQNDLLSNEQKSAHPSEGCYEHDFLLESIVNDARRQPCPPSPLMFEMPLAASHMMPSSPPSPTWVSLSHLHWSFHRSSHPLGKTQPIPIHSGVKQGCPLSAILFNLSMELILHKCNAQAQELPCGSLQHHGQSVSILTYADDLVILARNKASLQSLLNVVSSAADVLHLRFRPDKCTSLSLNKHGPWIQSNALLVQGEPIPDLQRENHYRYLGIPM